MAFTLTFPTTGSHPSPADVAGWLSEQGEPFEPEGSGTFALKALPMRLVTAEGGAMQAWVEVTSRAPLVRMIDLLFNLSVRAGSDVRLAGTGEMTRARLWMRLADEQDRVRIGESLDRADDRGNRDEVLTKLWAVLAVIQPGRDLRWDAGQRRIVELVEVGAPDGISVEEASWLVEGAAAGDVVPKPIEGCLHILAWRWLSEAYPGLAET